MVKWEKEITEDYVEWKRDLREDYGESDKRSRKTMVEWEEVREGYGKVSEGGQGILW
jgi:hypothetical protein